MIENHNLPSLMNRSSSKADRSSITFIIVNYNTSDLLRACLYSIKGQITLHDEVIVVDNHSSDDSVRMVREQFVWTSLIANESNAGFAQANNQALSLAKGELIWYLNPDTQLYEGAVSAALAFVRSNPNVGLAGTALRNPNGTSQESVELRYPGQRYTGKHFDHLPGKIAWVLGASMVARRDALQKIGGFDENFFLYGEDLDLCLELRKAGWPLGFIENCKVLHVGGQSERDSMPESVLRKKFKAELAFYEKHYPASAIKVIKRNYRIQAIWRICTLFPQKFIRPNNQSISAKFLKYRLAWEVYR